MKIARFFSLVFGAVGAVLMAGTLILCLTSLNDSVKLSDIPQEAQTCSEELELALETGDFAAASALMYGQPDLGVSTQPTDTLSTQLWDAFAQSIELEFKGPCYASESGICRDAVITALDIPGTMAGLQQRAHDLLTTQVENAESMEQLYDETFNFREELVQQVLQQAVEQTVALDALTVSRDVTLTMVRKDDRWWAVPDQALLQVVSGSIA